MTNEQTVDGPRVVRVREGKKGPGKVAAYATDQANAEAIGEVLKENGAADVVITPYSAPQIVTADEFQANEAEKLERAKARKELLASLQDKGYTSEKLAEMGIKV